MTERQFIENNKDDWKKLSALLQDNNRDAERLHQLFVKVSGDLSYAQTYYPKRNVRWYLNNLVAQVFDQMRAKSKFDLFGSFKRFYQHTLPREILRNRNYFIISMLVFVLSMFVGSYSTLQKKEYVVQILGPRYVGMTEENIKNEDPFAVYKGTEQSNMFLQITFNNVRVSFLAYVLGIFAGLGTIIILINNGIMVGAFQTFFYSKGLLLPSLLTIWVHGTIEILSIIVAGAAGLILGSHVANPGTYTRMESLKIGARRSLIVILSTVPLLIIAGFFEGFLTRMTDLPDLVKVGIIGSSLFFMVYIYIILPYRYSQFNELAMSDHEVSEIVNTAELENLNQNLSYLKQGFIHFGDNFGRIFSTIVFPAILVFSLILYHYIDTYKDEMDIINVDFSFFNLNLPSIFLFISDIVIVFIGLYIMRYVLIYQRSENSKLKFGGKELPLFLLFAILLVTPSYIIPNEYIDDLLVVFITLPFIAIYLFESSREEVNYFRNTFKKLINNFHRFLPMMLIVLIIGFLFSMFCEILMGLVKTTVSFENIFGNAALGTIYIEAVLERITILLLMPIAIFLYYHNVQKIQNEYYGDDVKQRVKDFTERDLINI